MNQIGPLLDGQPYHVGICVEDVGAAMEEYGALFGVEWAVRTTAEFPVQMSGERRNLVFDSVYTKTGPVRVEVTRHKPGTLWEAGRGIHHIGFWSDDVEADSKRLDAAGYPVEARLFPFPGEQTVAPVAFCRGPQGLFVELVSSVMRPAMQASWV